MKFIITICSSFLILASSLVWGNMDPYHFEKVNTNVYVMHGPLEEPNKENQGFMNNPAIVVGKHEVILVDPGGTYQTGKKVLKEIAKITDKPVGAVFNTHIHGDHWFGNQAIVEKYPEVKIYASPKMITRANGETAVIWLDSMKRMTEGLSSDTKIVPPFIALNNGQKIDIDGETFVIHSQEKAHTDTDIMIEHLQSKTLFLGDNGFLKRFGQFEESADIHGNIKALEIAKNLDITVYVPGHGQSGSFAHSVQPFLDYLILLRDKVKPGFEDDLEDFEIKQKIIADFAAYKDWHGFDTNFGKHVNKMYAEIEAAAF